MSLISLLPSIITDKDNKLSYFIYGIIASIYDYFSNSKVRLANKLKGFLRG